MIEGRGDNGKLLQRNTFKKALELAINNDIETVQIPITETKPEITVSEELEGLGLKEVLAIGYTSFYGSPRNRITNIAVGASKINGALIAPEEEFSFNKTMGLVDGKTGFLMELVIKPEGTIPEYGGGVCQISTTTYRAAIFAGLPITERYPHSYAVSYYSQVLGHGLDATVYSGGADLKFINNTGNYMLLQAYVKNKEELYIVLYGTADGRKVEMDGPYITDRQNPGPLVIIENPNLPEGVKKTPEKAHAGFKALWYRFITNKDGEITKEEIRTTYKAIPAKQEVGTGIIPQ